MNTQKLGKHLTNTSIYGGPKHWADVVVGPPLATYAYTQQQLVDLGMMGVYAKPEPDPEPTQEKFDGYYSRQAALEHGYAVYSDNHGNHFQVTEVVRKGKPPLSKWPDLLLSGSVTTFISSHSKCSDEPPKLVPWTFETCPKGVVLVKFKEAYGCDLITAWNCDGVSTPAFPVIGWNRLLNAFLYSTDGRTWLPCGTEEKR